MLKSMINAALRRSASGARLLDARSVALVGYLAAKGWPQSSRTYSALDAHGKPVPWYTYPFIDFIAPRIRPDMRVFEFGSGNSTLWWSARTRHVMSCEHDRAWYDTTQPKLPPNVDYRFVELQDGRYASTITGEGPFDIVVVDGRDRVNCAIATLDALEPDGVIVWDNSDRAEYEPGYRFLVDHGFKRLDFWGMGPINKYGWCTSVFYRPHNCLAI